MGKPICVHELSEDERATIHTWMHARNAPQRSKVLPSSAVLAPGVYWLMHFLGEEIVISERQC
jgi:hypothetical protein